VFAQDIKLATEEGELDLDAAIAEQRARHEFTAKDDLNYDDEERKQAEEKVMPLGFIIKDDSKHRIAIRNQMLHVEPPLEGAILTLSKDLQK
jgi:hypothetical protein